MTVRSLRILALGVGYVCATPETEMRTLGLTFD